MSEILSGNEVANETAPELAPMPLPNLDALRKAESEAMDTAMQAARESEARLFAAVESESEAAPVTALPRTVKGATTFFQSGAGAAWFAALPERMKAVGSWELLHSYKGFLARVQIARNLETRADELAALSAQIEAQGFTPADLVAFERQTRGQSPFNPNLPDYALPPGYRRADWQDEG